jgi:hypothetical protein
MFLLWNLYAGFGFNNNNNNNNNNSRPSQAMMTTASVLSSSKISLVCGEMAEKCNLVLEESATDSTWVISVCYHSSRLFGINRHQVNEVAECINYCLSTVPFPASRLHALVQIHCIVWIFLTHIFFYIEVSHIFCRATCMIVRTIDSYFRHYSSFLNQYIYNIFVSVWRKI